MIQFQTKGQKPAFEWALSFGGIDTDIAVDHVVDTDGNTYVLGEFNDTVDFDPGVGVVELIADRTKDVFIQKLDVEGNLVWAKHFGGEANLRIQDMVLDKDENVIITGAFSGEPFDIDPGTNEKIVASYGAWDCFILKLNSSGEFIWSRQIASPDWVWKNSLTVDTSGCIFVSGIFEDDLLVQTLTDTFHLVRKGNEENFIFKYDAMGQLLNAVSFGAIQDGIDDRDLISAMTIDQDLNLWVTGTFAGTADLDPGSEEYFIQTDGPASDVYVLKLTNELEFMSVRMVGGDDLDRAEDIVIDHNNDVYVTGNFRSTVNFDPESGSDLHTFTAGFFENIFLLKLNSENEFVSAIAMGSDKGESGYSIAIDNGNNVYLTGQFGQSVDFDPGEGEYILSSSSSFGAVFYMKLTENSEFCWASKIENRSFQESDGQTISIDAEDNIRLTSQFRGDADFDPTDENFTLISKDGSDDYFVLKLGSCQHLDLSISQTDNTLSVGETDGFYQWLNCDDDYDLVDGANQQSFTPAELGNYAVLVLSEGCLDTSECVDMTMSGIEPQIRPELFQVWPNPTNGTINVKLDSEIASACDIIIRDVTGKVVGKYKKTNMIDFKYILPNVKGLYTVELVTKNSRLITSVVRI